MGKGSFLAEQEKVEPLELPEVAIGRHQPMP